MGKEKNLELEEMLREDKVFLNKLDKREAGSRIATDFRVIGQSLLYR